MTHEQVAVLRPTEHTHIVLGSFQIRNSLLTVVCSAVQTICLVWQVLMHIYVSFIYMDITQANVQN